MMIRIIGLTISILLAVGFFLVSSFAFSKSNEGAKIEGRISQPVGNFQSIEVYRDNKVDKKYRVIGEVRVEGKLGSKRSELVALLKQKAAAMGGDAVIDMRFSTQRAGGHSGSFFCPTGQHDCYSVNPHSEYRPAAVGTAVKFIKD